MNCCISSMGGKRMNYDVIIIGAGPGGMFAAMTAAERGHDVTVWEKAGIIGGQLNLAVRSPGKQEMCKWLMHLDYRCKKAGG